MENLAAVRKLKMMLSCIIVAFVAAIVVATISFVQISNARRVSADYERQIEMLKDKYESNNSSLKDGELTDEAEKEIADENDMIQEGEVEIEQK